MSPSYKTDKGHDKFRRQQCINILEKITKNLFRMFRDTHTTQKQLTEKYAILMKKLARFDDVELYNTYHREMRKYIENFANLLQKNGKIEDMREKHMTQLNRLQKIKNQQSYKKEKHSQQLYKSVL